MTRPPCTEWAGVPAGARFVLGTWLVPVLLSLVWASGVAAADFEQYEVLVERANGAYELLESAPDHRQDALRETALDAIMAVTDWLDEFIESGEFEGLPEDHRTIVVRSRYRWEYNASTLLIALDRCEEGRDRVRSLLDRPMNDAELRPRLTEAYESAIECINRPRVAILSVTVEPPSAEVYVDGVLLGRADGEFEIDLGEHRIALRSPGFLSDERSINATVEGERVEVGPLVLLAEPEPDTGPTWLEWTLWGAGAAGVATGVTYFVQARNREDEIASPPPGQRVQDEQRELGIVDDLDLVSYLAGGLGLGLVVAGTLSFVMGGDDGEDTAATAGWSGAVEVGPRRVGLRLRF